METQEGDVVTIIFMLALLAFAVVLVDDRWLRTAIAVVPGLLIAHRALAASREVDSGRRVGAADRAVDRREDSQVRSYVDDLLKHFREFYSTCHLMSTGLMEPEDAERRAAQLEKELNRLLAEITDAARKKSGV